MNKISARDTQQYQAIHNLRTFQKVHDDLLEKMFAELTQKFHSKEMSDRFWDAIPADLKNKYKQPIANIRGKIRDIISKYPEYYSNYMAQNKPYFQKIDKAKRQKLLEALEEEAMAHEEVEIEQEVGVNR